MRYIRLFEQTELTAMGKLWVENHRLKEFNDLEGKNNMILFIYINYYNYSKQFKTMHVFCNV